MALNCPKCGLSLNASKIRNHFACPHCTAKLRGSASGAFVAGIVICILADLIIYPVVYSQLGDAWPMRLLRIVLSGCIGIPAILMLIGFFGKVEIDDTAK